MRRVGNREEVIKVNDEQFNGLVGLAHGSHRGQRIIGIAQSAQQVWRKDKGQVCGAH